MILKWSLKYLQLLMSHKSQHILKLNKVQQKSHDVNWLVKLRLKPEKQKISQTNFKTIIKCEHLFKHIYFINLNNTYFLPQDPAKYALYILLTWHNNGERVFYYVKFQAHGEKYKILFWH